MPPAGPINGYTHITISGINFYDTYSGGAWVKVGWMDKIGEHQVIGTGIDANRNSQLKLTTQPYNGPAGEAKMQISLNYLDYASHTFPFVFYNEPSVLSVNPSTGDPTGGTLVTVSGLNFMYNDVNKTLYMRCRFGKQAAYDNVVVNSNMGSKVIPEDGTSGQVICKAPPSEGPITVPLELTFNGQQFTSNGVQFKYMAPLVENGTCYNDAVGFDLAKGPCQRSSDCRTPVQFEKTAWYCQGAPYCRVSPTVNGNGQLLGSDCLNDRDCENLNPAYFKCESATGKCMFGMFSDWKVIDNWQLNAMHCKADSDCLAHKHLRYCTYPRMCRFGKNYGGGIMHKSECNSDADCNPDTMQVKAFFQCKVVNAKQLCKYKNLLIPQLQDYTPPGGVTSRLGYPTQCANDASCQDSTFFAAIRCSKRMQVQILSPNSGPDIGGTNVTITGLNFQNSKNMRCKFGNIQVFATYVSPTKVICTTPRRFQYQHIAGWAAGSCNVGQLNTLTNKTWLEDKLYDANTCSAECALRPWCSHFFVSTGVRIAPGVCLLTSPGCTSSDGTGTFNMYVNSFKELDVCDSRSCTTPTALVYVEVSNNYQEFTGDRVQFTYYSSMLHVNDIIPKIGPNNGQTEIAVYGMGFLNTGRLQPENIQCKFGTLKMQGTFNVSTGYVQCISPRAFDVKNWQEVAAYPNGRKAEDGGKSTWPERTTFDGIVPLELSFDNGQHFTTSNMSYRYSAAPIKVREIYPTFGPRTGGTQVTMVGDNFNLELMKEFGYLRLKMGSEYVKVVSFSPEVGEQWESTVTFTSTQERKEMRERAHLPAAQQGKVGGIRFTTPDASTIPPYYTASRVYPMEVPCEITINDQQFTTDQVKFTFYELPAVTMIMPTLGPSLGGTVVSIYGTNLLNYGQSACRFGTDQPQQLAKFVETQNITVLNGTVANCANTSDPNYRSNCRVYKSGYYECTTPPSITPLAKKPPPVVVDLSLNMESYQFTNKASFPSPFQLGVKTNHFRYHRVPVYIASLKPSTGPVSGGTVVTVTGLNFTNSLEIMCRFGYSRSGWNYSPRLSPATFKSETSMTCVSPPGNKTYNWLTQKWDHVTKVGTTFDLSLNSQQYTNFKMPYTYSFAVETFFVSKITPSEAPLISKEGTLLNVTGYYFDNTGEISCKFLAAFSPAMPLFQYETPATFSTPTVVTCWTPIFTLAERDALLVRSIALDVSLNSQNYRSDTDSTFLYKTVDFYDPNPPLNVTPASGPATGGTNVIVAFGKKQTNQYNSPLCRWSYRDDSLPFDSNDPNIPQHGVRKFVTPATTKVDTAVVRCSTPSKAEEVQILSATALPLLVSLEVSLNGQNYEPAYVNFTFYSASDINKLTPASGLTAADYEVTITGNNFLGGSDIRVKFGNALVLADKIKLVSPTKLVVTPPTKQSPGETNVYVTLNGQNWIDSCLKTFGATSDHVIVHGTCVKWTWAGDPVCFTCQTPIKPANAAGTSVNCCPNVLVLLCILAVATFLSLL